MRESIVHCSVLTSVFLDICERVCSGPHVLCIRVYFDSLCFAPSHFRCRQDDTPGVLSGIELPACGMPGDLIEAGLGLALGDVMGLSPEDRFLYPHCGITGMYAV